MSSRRPNQSETGSPPMAENFRLGSRRIALATAAMGNPSGNRGSRAAREAGRIQICRAILYSCAIHAGRRIVGNDYSCRQPLRRREGRQSCRLHRTGPARNHRRQSKSVWREGLHLIDLMSQHYNGEIIRRFQFRRTDRGSYRPFGQRSHDRSSRSPIFSRAETT